MSVDWSEVGGWIKKNAGTGAALVGSLLTGNVPAAVASGVALVTSATGEAEPDAVLATLQGDPASVVRLKELYYENEQQVRDHIERMAEIDLEERRTDTADIQDARDRDVEIRKQDPNHTNTRANLMIVGDVLGMLACLIAMVYVTWLGVTGGSKGAVQPIVMAINGPLGMLTQQFANGLRDAHNFEFGSSRGSKEKTEALTILGGNK